MTLRTKTSAHDCFDDGLDSVQFLLTSLGTAGVCRGVQRPGRRGCGGRPHRAL